MVRGGEGLRTESKGLSMKIAIRSYCVIQVQGHADGRTVEARLSGDFSCYRHARRIRDRLAGSHPRVRVVERCRHFDLTDSAQLQGFQQRIAELFASHTTRSGAEDGGVAAASADAGHSP